MNNKNQALSIKFLPGMRFQISTEHQQIVIASGQIKFLFESVNILNEGTGYLIREEISVETIFGTVNRRIAYWKNQTLEISLFVDQPDQWQNAIIFNVQIRNIADEPITMSSMSMPCISISSQLTKNAWTMQGVAVEWGQDFAFPLNFPFSRENDLGHTDNGESGGIPLMYFWNTTGGLAFAHLEPNQVMWHMPVVAESADTVKIALEKRDETTLAAGEVFTGLQTLLSYHQGDFYDPLALYRELLNRQGLCSPETNEENYQASWCSWGYEFDVQPTEMLRILPKLKDMGIHWLTLDDRWFDHYGDWHPREDTFPGGSHAMKSMVDEIHANNAYAQLWWYPLCVEDGVGEWDGFQYNHSQILKDHPDWLLLNVDGSVARNNRGLAILCPAVEAVQQYTLDLTKQFVREWGFDGHKLDNIYTVPPCHNPAHHHGHPEDSVRAFAEIYRKIFELTRALKPHSVTQICPCGTQILHTLIPAMDQAVTADPTSSQQIRRRTKFYKALLGPHSAVFADHVELSDGGMDFASELGTGGILATKFILEENQDIRSRLQEWWGLDDEKEKKWKKWFGLYNQLLLSKEEYLNVYDIAMDSPEGHVIRKGEEFYFAFYTSEPDGDFSGKIEFRGLQSKQYQLIDYVNEIPLGTIKGPAATLSLSFVHALLVKAVPVLN